MWMKDMKVTGNSQIGFTRVKSCCTNLITFCEEKMGSDNEGTEVDVFSPCLQQVISQSPTVSLQPEQRGVAGRSNRKIADKLDGFGKFVYYSELQQIGEITDHLQDRAATQKLARKKLCKKGPGGKQIEQKSAVCCCSDGVELDLEHPTYRERLMVFGLFSQEIEG